MNISPARHFWWRVLGHSNPAPAPIASLIQSRPRILESWRFITTAAAISASVNSLTIGPASATPPSSRITRTALKPGRHLPRGRQVSPNGLNATRHPARNSTSARIHQVRQSHSHRHYQTATPTKFAPAARPVSHGNPIHDPSALRRGRANNSHPPAIISQLANASHTPINLRATTPRHFTASTQSGKGTARGIGSLCVSILNNAPRAHTSTSSSARSLRQRRAARYPTAPPLPDHAKLAQPPEPPRQGQSFPKANNVRAGCVPVQWQFLSAFHITQRSRPARRPAVSGVSHPALSRIIRSGRRRPLRYHAFARVLPTMTNSWPHFFLLVRPIVPFAQDKIPHRSPAACSSSSFRNSHTAEAW